MELKVKSVPEIIGERDILKRRIQKAISLIEKHTTSFGSLILEKQLTKMLIDILEGEDK